MSYGQFAYNILASTPYVISVASTLSTERRILCVRTLLQKVTVIIVIILVPQVCFIDNLLLHLFDAVAAGVALRLSNQGTAL